MHFVSLLHDRSSYRYHRRSAQAYIARPGRVRFSVEANWAGYGDVGWQAFFKDQPDVHRIKVDEELGIIITTHQEGGLTVRDLDTNELLWALPPVRRLLWD